MSSSSNNRDGEDDTPETRLDRATILSAIILIIPPGLAFAAAAFPGYVPAPFVDLSAAEGVRPVLVATGLVLLVVNAGILWLMRRKAQDVS